MRGKEDGNDVWILIAWIVLTIIAYFIPWGVDVSLGTLVGGIILAIVLWLGYRVS
jgi:hypothetical protein